ncbi:MAG TPA: sortase [Candidatus Woesebacteria bacterium]|nr:sortase [Candidatus Woesebacteria bacterium]
MNNTTPVFDQSSREQLVRLCRHSLMSGTEYEQMQAKIYQGYLKLKLAAQTEQQLAAERPKKIKQRLSKWVRLGAFVLPLSLLSAGLYLVSLAVVPILGYYIEDVRNPSEPSLKSPLPRQYVMDLTPMVISSGDYTQGPSVEPEIVELSLDYTNLANWFVDSHLPELNQSKIVPAPELTEYFLEIPKLNLTEAKVKVGGSDLNQSLIAYPGTGLPGEYGAPVIFGHSVLRKFYNPSPKNPRRYNSIFSYIMSLEPGKDTIVITAGDKRYVYLVQDKTEVNPEDVYILTQQYDAKRLKLVTCVPEGTYLKRGVVTAQLIEGGDE